MNIHNLNPEDVLLERHFAEYKQGMDFFFLKQLVPLNLNIYYIEQIIQFPFHLFAQHEKSTFLKVVIHNLIDVGLLIITRSSTDSQGDPFTLLRFKNQVRMMLKTDYQELFDEQMRLVRFDSETRSLFQKARDLRNVRIAHIDQAIVSGEIVIDSITILELKKLRNALNSLLDALAFNIEYVLLPTQYNSRTSDRVGIKHTTDIEDILNSIAQNSHLLNLAEKNPRRWDHRKKRRNATDIALLNKYRAKFDLPELSQ